MRIHPPPFPIPCFSSILLPLLPLLQLLTYTYSECPNACNQQGLCDFYDMCNCFRGFTGGDCSERICPYDYSFVTSPQGDLNMDGDRDDNSWRRLSKHVKQFSVGGSVITLTGAFDRFEVDFGDLIKIHDYVYEVQWTCTYTVTNGTDCISDTMATNTTNSSDDSNGRRRLVAGGVTGVMADYDEGEAPDDEPTNLCRSCTRSIDYPNYVIGERWTEITVESRMEGLLHGFVSIWAKPELELLTEKERLKEEAKKKKVLDGYPIFRHLRTQSRPYGTWEKWPGNFFGAGQVGETADEGHFYMECSNRGACNRALGICECYNGYTGHACQFQQCPGLIPSKSKSEYAVGIPCHGHGTCMTVHELASHQLAEIDSHASTSAGSTIIHTEKDVRNLLDIGDQIIIGVNNDIGTGIIKSNVGMLTELNKPAANVYSDTVPPYIVESTHPNRIVVTRPLHRTYPYGTMLRQIKKYNLWDTHKNRACTCGHRYFGNACESRKCPRGDDPLTELGYDGIDNTVNVIKEEHRASFYEQKPERQTIYMSTNGGRLFGTFRLTMEDEYGDRWTTKPIPTKVRLSIVPRDSPTYILNPLTGEVAEYGVVIDFGNYQQIGNNNNIISNGLNINEIGIGDLLQCGDEYRVVQRLVYMDSTTKIGRTKYRYVHTSGSMRDVTAGRPWYRINVAKEIRNALLKLPIIRMKDVTVEGIYKTGRRLSADVNTYLNVDRAEFYSDVININSPEDTIAIGDYIRVGKEIRQILGITTANRKYQIKPFHYPTTLSGAFKHTGMDYEISFQNGCQNHLDCQNNGIDDFDSDSGTSSSSGYSTYETGATCHPGGKCQCSDPTKYYGEGCTRSGKGTHAAFERIGSGSIPGNIPLLHCDTRQLFTGQTLDVTASVTRLKPNRVHLTATPDIPRSLALGDEIALDNQRRQIIQIVDLGGDATSGPIDIVVDYPFQENQLSSTFSYLFRPFTPIQRVGGPLRDDPNKGRHGNFARCLVTDIRPVSDETLFCVENSERPHCGRATVSGNGIMLNRIVTFGGRITDPNDYDSDSNINERVPGFVSSMHELRVGDRLRIITSGPSTESSTLSPTWETRTIDSVIYQHTPMGIIPSEKAITGVTVSFGYSNAHDLKPVFVDTSGTTENEICSGRGICQEKSGGCKCFSGYGDFDCSRQETLQM